MTTVPRLCLGSRVLIDGEPQTVVGLSGTTVMLVDEERRPSAMLLTHLLASPGFVVLDAAPPRRLGADSLVTAFGDEVAEHARWLEGHLQEVETGRHPDRLDQQARYDPTTRTLQQRLQTKTAELAGEGVDLSPRTLRRYHDAYQRCGLWGLVDKRQTRQRHGPPAVDARVTDALARAMAGQQDKSTVTRDALFAQVRAELVDKLGETEARRLIPSRSTFYRLAGHLDGGRHTFGAATSRRTHANRPARPFRPVVATRPGEIVQIDTNTVDILCRFSDGVVRRPELTLAVDLATRTLTAGVISPTGKDVDAAVLLARMLVPEPMRPGWPDRLHLTRSALPADRLVALDDRMRYAAAKPVIFPETVVVDHGAIYLSATFKRACRTLGISLQPARPYTPTDKSVVERTFLSINTLFCQHVDGYVGRHVAHRGRTADTDAVLTLAQLQEVFDEWAVSVWQNRPHEGLSCIWSDGRAISPNDMYAAAVTIAGYLPTSLTGDDYLELLPAKLRTVNDYGLTIDGRRYDCPAINPLRRTYSGLPQPGRWEIHHDPYDVTAVWLRGPDGEWITVTWVYAGLVGEPFGADLYQHVRRTLSRRDGAPDELDVARTVKEILARHQARGALDPADLRAAARDGNSPKTRRAQLAAVPTVRPAVDDEPTTPCDLPTGPLGTFGVVDAADDWRY